MTVRWTKVKTSGSVYSLLLETHKDDLTVFESFSDPDGGMRGGSTGEMETVWGLKGADCALFGARTTWDIARDEELGIPFRNNQQTEYWLCKPVEDNDD